MTLLENLRIPLRLERIVEEMRINGGKSYLVGGSVVDYLQGKDINDWDIEVYGMTNRDLKSILSKFNKTVFIGKSFGTVKTRFDGIPCDFTVPVGESRVGPMHKDYKENDFQEIGTKNASSRRDLTINSMLIDLDEKYLIDHYRGLEDLRNGILRHTSEKFSDDPLRVLRVMQLLARKGDRVAPETIELCKILNDKYESIPKDRIYGEWNKLLLKSEKPSKGLDFLENCEWIKHYPKLDVLRETPQNTDWHPEGNVWDHTKLVVDNAAKLREKIPQEWKKAFMYGCLLHDVGKAVTTSPELRSYGHEKEGASIAYNFMKNLTTDKNLINKTVAIVKNHMRPKQLHKRGAKENKWKRLHNEVPLNVIGYVSKADSKERKWKSLYDFHAPLNKSLEFFNKYGEGKIHPILRGKDLIDMGFTQGPEIGKKLEQAYDVQINEGIIDKYKLIEMLNLT